MIAYSVCNWTRRRCGQIVRGGCSCMPWCWFPRRSISSNLVACTG